MTPNLPIRDVSVPTPDAPNARIALTTPKIKLGDAINAIGQSLQGFELQITRDKTPTDAANFE